MKNEIKEIQNNFENILDIKMNEEITFDLTIEESKKLFNYITNLQEENKGLHTRIKTIKRRRKTQTAKMRKYREEITNKQNSIVDYKSRNEKTIEYIKHEWFKREQIGIAPLNFSYEELQNVLNILQGEDKE